MTTICISRCIDCGADDEPLRLTQRGAICTRCQNRKLRANIEKISTEGRALGLSETTVDLIATYLRLWSLDDRPRCGAFGPLAESISKTLMNLDRADFFVAVHSLGKDRSVKAVAWLETRQQADFVGWFWGNWVNTEVSINPKSERERLLWMRPLRKAHLLEGEI